MTAYPSMTVLAVAALLSAPCAAGATAPPGTSRVAQAAAPLEIPAAPSLPAPGASPAPEENPPSFTAPPGGDDGDTPDGELSLGDIPIIETIELTPDIAKRALDSYIAAREKYVNSDLEAYENLQDFVDQTEEGKAFEADIKAAGFPNVTEWNLAITTLSLTYGSVVDDQTSDLMLQIKEVEGDTEMAQDIKDRMVKALKALIPSDNNRKVIEGLMEDTAYGPKLKLLDIEEE